MGFDFLLQIRPYFWLQRIPEYRVDWVSPGLYDFVWFWVSMKFYDGAAFQSLPRLIWI